MVLPQGFKNAPTICREALAKNLRYLQLNEKSYSNIPGGGHGNPLQYSCLENPMDRGA